MLQAVLAPLSIADISKAMLKSSSPMLMAGGTTVMPLINSGMHDVATLVSLKHAGIAGISVSKKAGVRIGAATRDPQGPARLGPLAGIVPPSWRESGISFGLGVMIFMPLSVSAFL